MKTTQLFDNRISKRGIWTWGHVIYDYRGFFRNMQKLGFNRITIWNDFAPVNAREIIDEAHICGIKVIWGFSWGWKAGCGESVRDISPVKLKKIRNEVIKEFDSQYKDIAGDGIYFQSFTELGDDSIGGINIAEAVVELVNSTSEELWKKNPELSIEFGLHATSVKNNLDVIAGTDKRVRIIWEDLGSFPFSYDSSLSEGFSETLALTEKVINLRGAEERCGFIIKGMTQLDWSGFTYATEPLTIGESSKEFIFERQKEKDPVWEKSLAGWKKNLPLAEQIFNIFLTSGKDTVVQALIEDGMFENEIKEPAVIFSNLCNGIASKAQ